MCNLALSYDNGHGTQQDYAAARVWYEKAATADDTNTMVNLGALQVRGQGGPQDYVKALPWYWKATDAGQATAMDDLIPSLMGQNP